MRIEKNKMYIFGLIVLMLIVVTCAPNNERFSAETPAGFWAGFWHGFICWITFIIGLFTDSVRMYEINNNGGGYDFGYLIGVGMVFGSGGWKTCGKKKRKKSQREKEWEEIGLKVEEKVKKGIKSWIDESEKKDMDWKEIGENIEEKIKRELRNWAEK